MDTLELIDKREQLRKQATEIVDGAKKETRMLSNDEQKQFDSLTQQIADTNNEIRKIDEQNKKQINKTEKRTMSKFSLLKAINDVANNRNLDDSAKEVVDAGIAEMRKAGQSYSGQIVLPIEERATVAATVATAGQENVPEDKLGILEPLRANLVLTQAGANYMTGLVGNLSIPVYSGSNVAWAAENGAATDGAGTFKEITLEPKRLTAFIDISKQFLIQDSNSAEEMLKRDIVTALSNKLEATILGSAAGSTTQPAGIFNGVTADTIAVTYADIANLEATLDSANVMGDCKFILSPKAKATLKTTQKGSGTGFIMDGTEVDGVTSLVTSAMPDKGVIYGNFADYVIGQWGGIDLTVDPYTQAASGKVRLVINAYFDAKPRRTESFATKILK